MDTQCLRKVEHFDLLESAANSVTIAVLRHGNTRVSTAYFFLFACSESLYNSLDQIHQVTDNDQY